MFNTYIGLIFVLLVALTPSWAADSELVFETVDLQKHSSISSFLSSTPFYKQKKASLYGPNGIVFKILSINRLELAKARKLSKSYQFKIPKEYLEYPELKPKVENVEVQPLLAETHFVENVPATEKEVNKFKFSLGLSYKPVSKFVWHDDVSTSTTLKNTIGLYLQFHLINPTISHDFFLDVSKAKTTEFDMPLTYWFEYKLRFNSQRDIAFFLEGYSENISWLYFQNNSFEQSSSTLFGVGGGISYVLNKNQNLLFDLTSGQGTNDLKNDVFYRLQLGYEYQFNTRLGLDLKIDYMELGFSNREKLSRFRSFTGLKFIF